jgi:Fe2+ transport system protein B
MDKLLDLLKGAAPALATAVAGPMGGMAVKMIADKLGVGNTVDEVAQAIQADPNLVLKLKDLDLKAFEKEVEDRKDARAMATVALKSDDQFVRRFTYYFIAAWSIFAMIYIPCMTFAEIPERNVRFADTILGFLLGTVVASMFAFLLGSSFGSRQKDNK